MNFFKAFYLINFSKEFKKFRYEYLSKSPEIFFQDGRRILSVEEKQFIQLLEIRIARCENKIRRKSQNTRKWKKK